MRYPRNVRIFRGQLDPAPFAAVFFLLVIFLLLNSQLVFTPGLRVELPEGVNLPGSMNRTVVVAVDEGGQLYFKRQIIASRELATELATIAAESKEPVTLIIQADKNARYDSLVQLGLLARSSGIKETLLATRPPPVPKPGTASKKL